MRPSSSSRRCAPQGRRAPGEAGEHGAACPRASRSPCGRCSEGMRRRGCRSHPRPYGRVADDGRASASRLRRLHALRNIRSGGRTVRASFSTPILPRGRSAGGVRPGLPERVGTPRPARCGGGAAGRRTRAHQPGASPAGRRCPRAPRRPLDAGLAFAQRVGLMPRRARAGASARASSASSSARRTESSARSASVSKRRASSPRRWSNRSALFLLHIVTASVYRTSAPPANPGERPPPSFTRPTHRVTLAARNARRAVFAQSPSWTPDMRALPPRNAGASTRERTASST